MRAPDGEVHIKRVEIDLEVRYGLASVQDEDRTYFMRTLDDRGDVGDGTRGVAHVGDGHDLGTLGDDFVEVVAPVR